MGERTSTMGGLTNRYWKGKDVLITGHTGFKGMWLAIYLAKMGAKITGVSETGNDVEKVLYDSVESSTIFDREEFIDIRDKERIESFIATTNPEILFHLAAQPLVRLSYKKPTETFETNIIGTINVLNGVRLAPRTNKVICVTSDKCYRNTEQVWGYREGDPLGGEDPYSASKGAAEIVAYSMWSSFLKEQNVSMATVRAGNVIGGGDFSKDRIMTDIVNSYFKKQKLIIRNPSATRPWQHVLDPIYAYTLLVEEELSNSPCSYFSYNIGPDGGNIKSVSDLVNEVKNFWDLEIHQNIYADSDMHEANLLSLDNSKIKSQTSWRPNWDFKKTIEITLDWYRKFSQNTNTIALCHADIENYFLETLK